MPSQKNKSILEGKKMDIFKHKKGVIIALTLIMVVGIFLRVYHFGDWLHFELDQSRDAKVVGLALEQGIGNLPLLGPKAAGSFLRLGPIFYYIEYLSGLIFGNNPESIAILSLIFSLLSLPLFYLLSRKKFDQKISLALLTLFSTSLFLVMYSRFSWNPNNLPFFIMGFFYSILRLVDQEEGKKGLWLIAASVFFSFASQLHFVALMSLPVIAGTFLLWKRPIIKLKFWIAAVLVLVFFYIPPIVNDFKTGGDNIKEFEAVFLKKSTKDKDKHTLIEKIIKSSEESVLGYGLLASSYQKAELPIVRNDGLKLDVICDKDCKDRFPAGLLMGIFFTLGVLSVALRLFSKKDQTTGRDFTILMTIWFVTVLGLFVPISFSLAPRFFLLIAPLPFFMVGYMLEFMQKGKMKIVAYVFVAILLMLNLRAVSERFKQLANAGIENFDSGSDKILKEKMRVTLQQQLKITDYMESVQKQNKFPIYLNSEAFYRRALLYHLSKRGALSDDFRNTGNIIYAQGNYFLIYPANDSAEEIAEKYLASYTISDVKDFGTLRVVRLIPRTEAINAQLQVFGPEKKPTSAKGVPVRCRWNEILDKCNTDGTEDNEGDIE